MWHGEFVRNRKCLRWISTCPFGCRNGNKKQENGKGKNKYFIFNWETVTCAKMHYTLIGCLKTIKVLQ